MSITERVNNKLFEEVKNGDLFNVSALIEIGADVNALDEYGQTPLMKAILEKQTAISFFLIENGADLDIQDIFKNTALSYTALGAQETVFKALLEAGASVHFKDERGENITDLLYRCYQMADSDQKESYQRMISEFVPDFIHREKQRSLTLAIVNGHDGIVSLMMQDEDIEVNETDGATLSALQWAAAFNKEKAAYCLIQNGAFVDYQDKNGMTALMYAAKNGHKEMVQLLLKEGSGIGLQNKEGKTAMMLAYENQQTDVFELIKQESLKRLMPKKQVYLTHAQREKE